MDCKWLGDMAFDADIFFLWEKLLRALDSLLQFFILPTVVLISGEGRESWTRDHTLFSWSLLPYNLALFPTLCVDRYCFSVSNFFEEGMDGCVVVRVMCWSLDK